MEWIDANNDPREASEMWTNLAKQVDSNPVPLRLAPSGPCPFTTTVTAFLFGGADLSFPCGQDWQYMGTWINGGRWTHSFRHRCGRGHNERANVEVPVSQGWKPPSKDTLATFDERDCGGAYDGYTVSSDADPGL